MRERDPRARETTLTVTTLTVCPWNAAQQGSATLNGCRLVKCDVAFTAGVGGGQSLMAEGCEVRECMRLWYDDDRPAVAVTRENSVTLVVLEK